METPLIRDAAVPVTLRARSALAVRQNRLVALVILLLALLSIAPMFAPYDPRGAGEVSFSRNHPPSLAHPFGTDDSDRDVLSRVLQGCQTSLAIAGLAMVVTLTLGTAYGAFAAMSGGLVDTLCMRIIDVALSIPRLLILLAVIAMWDNLSLAELGLLLGFTGWFDVARVTRGEVAALLKRDFVLATHAIGVGRLRLAMQHIAPHLIPMLLVMATVGIGNTIALEAGLMFLGAGMSPSAPTLGTILQGGGALMQHWWVTIFPGAAIVLVVLSCNALGDALRQSFAPEQVHAS